MSMSHTPVGKPSVRFARLTSQALKTEGR